MAVSDVPSRNRRQRRLVDARPRSQTAAIKLKPRRVRFTETATSHVDRERAWWLESISLMLQLAKALEIVAPAGAGNTLRARGARPAPSLY